MKHSELLSALSKKAKHIHMAAHAEQL